MLTELRLKNFKCFGTEVVVPLGKLNLLTGINAKGKSTTLQALLVLSQSIDRALSGGRLLDRIELNGRYTHLGTFRDVQNRDRPKSEPIHFAFEFRDSVQITTTTHVHVQHTDDEARWANLARVEVERLKGRDLDFADEREATSAGPLVLDFREQEGDTLAIASGLNRLGRVHYVGADRLGPQDFFAWSDEPGFLSVGVRGERTAEILHQASRHQWDLPAEDPRARGEEESETLLVADQASAWLSYIFDGGKVRVGAPYPTILTLEMNADGSAHYYRPMNVGFGYSYVLPMVVAGLVAKGGEILIVENPEAHLHPLAQSRMGEFLATVSRAGVQVFVESHSEHVLNAFRLAVKETWTASEDLSVLYFRRHDVDPILRIEVLPDGRITNWPKDFFDQRTQDFVRLFGEPGA